MYLRIFESKEAPVPQRNVATKALADLLNVLSHPDRIRIVEELRDGERDVGTLAELLGKSAVRTSQHLSSLRLSHLVVENRQGRHVYYRLTRPEVATWLLQGFRFVEPDAAHSHDLRAALDAAQLLWGSVEQKGG